MQIKLVGVQPMDFTLDNGYHFDGIRIHAIDLETMADGQIGNQIMDFKIPSSSPLMNTPLQVGEEYTVYFTKKGAPDFLVKSEKGGGR